MKTIKLGQYSKMRSSKNYLETMKEVSRLISIGVKPKDIIFHKVCGFLSIRVGG